MNNALLVAWRATQTDSQGWTPVGRLDHVGTGYRFVYTEGAHQAEGFRPFSGMGDLEEVYESDELLPLFSNRLLSESRPEYDAFLRWGGFDPDNPPDPISILGVTEGMRQTDSVEVFPCPTPDSSGCYLNKFFLHGVRWVSKTALDRISLLKPGEPLLLMLDPQNSVDPNAVALRIEDGDRSMVGYVPRYLASDVRRLAGKCDLEFIKIGVERLNPDAPYQNRVLCRMEACWPEGFYPCSGETFQPIPSTIPSTIDGRYPA